MNITSVMDALSNRLDTISGLRCQAWPSGAATPPAALIGYPSEYDYDLTYGRGCDRMVVPVVVVIGRATDRTARDQLSAYVAGAGASSVKAVLESGTYTAFDVCVVERAEFDVYTLAGTDYLAAIFDVAVVGPGGS